MLPGDFPGVREHEDPAVLVRVGVRPKSGRSCRLAPTTHDNGREAGLVAAQVIRGKDPGRDSVPGYEEDPPLGQPRQCPPLLGRDPESLAREGRRGTPRRGERPATGRIN